MNTLIHLAERWEAEATLLDAYGASEGAAAARKHAAELLEALTAAREELLTLDEAAAVSGYAPRTLREKVSEGIIPNAGEKGRPRIRRGDLPQRVRKRSTQRRGGFDPTAEARAIMGHKRDG